MFSREVLIDSLTVVKEEALSGEYKNSRVGICGKWTDMLLDDKYGIGYDLVSVFSPSWKCYSGESYLPIVGHYAQDKLWEGEQLELRLSLIDHILKRLEEVDQGWLDELYEEAYSE